MNIDVSHMSNEELAQLAGSYQEPANQTIQQQPQESPGLLSQLWNAQKDYTKGALHGSGQALGDIGASIGNLGISGLEKLSGRQIPHIPHPNLINQNPSSLSESLGQTISKGLTPMLIPGGAGLKAAKYGKGALQKLLAGTGAGAAIGAAENEENRGLGALSGAIGGSIPVAGQMLSKINSKNIAKDVMQGMKEAQNVYSKEFNNIFEEANKRGINKDIGRIKADERLLSRGGDSSLIHAIKEHNKNPSIKGLHEAQSDLGKYIKKIGKPEGKLERDALEHAKDLQKRTQAQIRQELVNKGSPDLAMQYTEARHGYKKDVAPYLQSKAIKAYEKGDLRSKNFADQLLKEEKFVSKMGEKHPELSQRESYNKVKKSNLAKGAAIGTAALLLPYEISKLLGMR